jgi:ADP-heptose:LPS heptosyltransferase
MLHRLILNVADSIKSRPRDRGPARGVLLIAAGGLGDIVLFSRVIERYRALAETDEPVTMLLRRDAAAMAFLMPPDVAVETVDFRRLGGEIGYRRATLKRLFEANYRLVVTVDYLRHPFLDESLVVAAAAPKAAAMVARPWAKYDHLLDRNRALYGRLFDSGEARRDKVLRWAAFADWLTGDDAAAPTIRLSNDELAGLAAPADPPAPSVVIQPFSAVAAKQPGVEFFAALIAAVPVDHRVVLTGAPADLRRNPAFEALLDEPRVTFDASTFADLVPTLRAARLVISVDTALMHLAAILGARTLCLASAAYVGEIVPYAPELAPENLTVVYETMPCEGCLGSCIHDLEAGMFPCIARLDRAAAVDHVASVLSGPAS